MEGGGGTFSRGGGGGVGWGGGGGDLSNPLPMRRLLISHNKCP